MPPHSYQQDTLPSHPADWQYSPALDPVVITTVQIPAHAKIGNLDGVVVPNQAVARSQISVHKIEGSQILHAGGNLGSHEQEVEAAEKGKKIQAVNGEILWDPVKATPPHT